MAFVKVTPRLEKITQDFFPLLQAKEKFSTSFKQVFQEDRSAVVSLEGLHRTFFDAVQALTLWQSMLDSLETPVPNMLSEFSQELRNLFGLSIDSAQAAFEAKQAVEELIRKTEEEITNIRSFRLGEQRGILQYAAEIDPETVNVSLARQTRLPKPQPPTSLVVTNGQDAKTTISFIPSISEKVVFHRIYVDGSQFFATTRNTGVEVTGLQNGVEVEIALSAVNEDGLESDKISQKVVPFDITPPLNATALQVLTGDTCISLEWTKSSSPDVIGYHLYVDRGFGFEPPMNMGNTDRFTLPDLVNGFSYNFRLTAFDDDLNESLPLEFSKTPLSVILTIDSVAIVSPPPGPPPIPATWVKVVVKSNRPLKFPVAYPPGFLNPRVKLTWNMGVDELILDTITMATPTEFNCEAGVFAPDIPSGLTHVWVIGFGENGDYGITEDDVSL